MSIVGLRMVKELNGILSYSLEGQPQTKQSIAATRSFGQKLTELAPISEAVASFTARVGKKLRKQHSCASLLQVFVQNNPFRPDQPQYFGSKTLELPVATSSTPELIYYALQGLKLLWRENYHYKKAGVVVSGLVSEENVQFSLFDPVNRLRDREAMNALDNLNKKLGRDHVRLAAMGVDRKWHMKREHLSRRYTTRLSELLIVKAK